MLILQIRDRSPNSVAEAGRFWLLNLCFSLPIGCYQSWGGVLNLNLAGVQRLDQRSIRMGSADLRDSHKQKTDLETDQEV